MSTILSTRIRPWLVLAVVLAADALDLLDGTLTNVAAPTIAAELGGGSLIPWLGAGYALALGSLLVLGGRLGDRYGQRRTFLLGIVGFTAASLACGLAPSALALVFARLVQGAFGALLIPQGFALLQRSFPRDRLGAAFSLFGPVLGCCAVGGPLLGGLLIDLDLAGLSWRPMFLINLVLGGLILAAALAVLPPDEPASERGLVAIDLPGSVLLTGSMLGLLGGLISGGNLGWGPVPLGLLGLGLLGGMLFAHRQRTASNPLITPSLFGNRGFVAGLCVGVAFFAAVSGMLYVISLYLQVGLGNPPGRAALLGAPVALGVVLATTACFRLIHRLGRTLIAIGLGTTLLGSLAFLAVVGLSGPIPALLGCFLLIGAGMGCCFGSIFAVAIGDINPHEAGSASGSLNAVQQLANAAGAAALSTVFLGVGDQLGYRAATSVSLLVVAGVTCLSLAVLRLLPKRAAAQH